MNVDEAKVFLIDRFIPAMHKVLAIGWTQSWRIEGNTLCYIDSDSDTDSDQSPSFEMKFVKQ